MAKREPRAPAIPPPVAAADEIGTIKEILLLTLLLTVFDRDSKILQESRLKTKQPYVDLLQRAMDDAAADLAYLRRRLREKGIKITAERRDKAGVGCEYWCRGYKASFEMLWPFAKAETEIRMRKYLGEDIRKYVRDDLPEELKPRWLLAPVRMGGRSGGDPGREPSPRGPSPGTGTAAPVVPGAFLRDPLHEGDRAGPDEGGGQPQEEPAGVAQRGVYQAVRAPQDQEGNP